MQKCLFFILATPLLFASDWGFKIVDMDDKSAQVSNEDAPHSYRVPPEHPYEIPVEIPSTDFDPQLVKKLEESQAVSTLEE